MQHNIQYIIGPNSLTYYDTSGKARQIRSDAANFKRVTDLLLNGSPTIAELNALSDTVSAVQNSISSAVSGRYLKRGVVNVTNGGVYYNDQLVDTSLTTRMVRIVNSGGDIMPWVAFMEKLYSNPNHTTRFELYDWMSSCSLPLTTDGDFLAYKRVRDDYMDCYTGKLSNQVGNHVALADRSKVDPVRTNVCSTGLHFCSPGYLPHFSGARVMILKINPGDVVSIPVDYKYTKGRAWCYDVVGEVTLDFATSHEWPAVVRPSQYNLTLEESYASV